MAKKHWIGEPSPQVREIIRTETKRESNDLISELRRGTIVDKRNILSRMIRDVKAGKLDIEVFRDVITRGGFLLELQEMEKTIRGSRTRNLVATYQLLCKQCEYRHWYEGPLRDQWLCPICTHFAPFTEFLENGNPLAGRRNMNNPIVCPKCGKMFSHYKDDTKNLSEYERHARLFCSGKPGKKSKEIKRWNPVSLYEQFHGVTPIRKKKVYYEPPPKELINIGELSQLNYCPVRGKHQGTEFYHKSGDLGERTLATNLILATDKAGKNLYLVRKKKDKYPTFTKRGIIG